MSRIKIKTRITKETIFNSYFKRKFFEILCDISELELDKKEETMEIKILDLERLSNGHKITAALRTKEVQNHFAIVGIILNNKENIIDADYVRHEAYLVAQLKGSKEIRTYLRSLRSKKRS